MCFFINKHMDCGCKLSYCSSSLILLLFIPCNLYKYGLKHTPVLCVQDIEILWVLFLEACHYCNSEGQQQRRKASDSKCSPLIQTTVVLNIIYKSTLIWSPSSCSSSNSNIVNNVMVWNRHQQAILRVTLTERLMLWVCICLCSVPQILFTKSDCILW